MVVFILNWAHLLGLCSKLLSIHLLNDRIVIAFHFGNGKAFIKHFSPLTDHSKCLRQKGTFIQYTLSTSQPILESPVILSGMKCEFSQPGDLNPEQRSIIALLNLSVWFLSFFFLLLLTNTFFQCSLLPNTCSHFPSYCITPITSPLQEQMILRVRNTCWPLSLSGPADEWNPVRPSCRGGTLVGYFGGLTELIPARGLRGGISERAPIFSEGVFRICQQPLLVSLMVAIKYL